MAISVRFRLRPHDPGSPTDSPRFLQVAFSIDGIDKGGRFAARLLSPTSPEDYLDGETIALHPVTDPKKPLPGQWDQKGQKQVGRDMEINNRLATIKAGLIRLHADQYARFKNRKGPKPTPNTVKEELITGKPPGEGIRSIIAPNPFAPVITLEENISLLDAYRVYIIHLTITNTNGEIAKATLDKWDYGLTYLISFVGVSGPILVHQVTRPWAKEYHAWLMRTGNMAADAATRYVKRVSTVLDYVADEGVLPYNKIKDMVLPRDGTADVSFLSKDQYSAFWKLEMTGTAGVVHWWMGIMLLTGLDFPDAERYVADPAKYTQSGIGGKKIVMNRGKKPHTECRPPLLPQVEIMLQNVPTNKIDAGLIRRNTDSIATLIGYEQRLVPKTLRKTAGANFLWMGHTMAAVSRFLGHRSVAVTERYYVKVTADYSDHEMERVRRLNRTDDDDTGPDQKTA